MRYLAILLALLALAAPAPGQVQSRPSEPPIVTAENDAWYQQGEPVQFGGDLYYRAGAAVFFNRNTMVRTGHYNGVPLYADATLEPFSIVYVPVSRGMMQPYERPRRGQLAGTTGSRTPSFPVAVVPESQPVAMAAAPPTNVGRTPSDAPAAVGTAGTLAAAETTLATADLGAVTRPQHGATVSTARPPDGNDGVWVSFMGEKWVSAGPAIPLSASGFIQVGEHAGFPVYTRAGLREDVIYLPARSGLAAPYRLKD